MNLLNFILRKLTFLDAQFLKNKFNQACQQYTKTQEQVLLKKIRRVQNSEIGRQFNFNQIKSIQDFQNQVPLHHYEDLAPYIEKVKEGKTEALFRKDEKIFMFALSSGTTATPKMIPVTKDFLNEYKRGSFLWGVYCVDSHDSILDGKILPLVSPSCEQKTDLGVACGAISGLIAETQKYIARKLYAVPGWAYQIKDVLIRDYTFLRYALPQDVTFLTTANPSTLVRLAKAADLNKASLVRDIRDGTINVSQQLEEAGFPKTTYHFKPNPEKAKQLEKLLNGSTPFHPKYFWPNLKVVACWKGGTLSSYLPAVKDYYGEMPIRDLGLLASEGRMTVPIHDTGSGGILDIQNHFFEFIPEGEEESLHPTILLGNQLEKGKKYFILLTTSSGLYRYHIHDLVKVVDFHFETPVLCFLNKGKYFSSITGEKLTEYQVVQAVQCSSLKHQIRLERFLLTPVWGEPPSYRLIVERDDSVDGKRWESFLNQMEQELRRLNPEYLSKRESQRLAEPQITFVLPNTFKLRDDKQRQLQLGRYEQFKPRFLSNDLRHVDEFEKLT